MCSKMAVFSHFVDISCHFHLYVYFILHIHHVYIFIYYSFTHLSKLRNIWVWYFLISWTTPATALCAFVRWPVVHPSYLNVLKIGHLQASYDVFYVYDVCWCDSFVFQYISLSLSLWIWNRHDPRIHFLVVLFIT